MATIYQRIAHLNLQRGFDKRRHQLTRENVGQVIARRAGTGRLAPPATAGEAYNRARVRCAQVGETPEVFTVLWGLWLFYFGQGDHPTARALGEQCLHLAQRLEDTELLLEAHVTLGGALFHLGLQFPLTSLVWSH